MGDLTFTMHDNGNPKCAGCQAMNIVDSMFNMTSDSEGLSAAIEGSLAAVAVNAVAFRKSDKLDTLKDELLRQFGAAIDHFLAERIGNQAQGATTQ